MSNARALASWRNAADTATLGLTGTGALADFPLSNLKVRGLGAVFKTEFMIGAAASVTVARTVSAGGVDAYRNKLDAPAYAFATQPDGKILVGGAFATSEGVSTGTLIRTLPDGTRDMSFNPQVGAGGDVLNTILVQPDGKILIGGSFITVGGVTQFYFARLDADGTLDTAYPATFDASVRALAAQPDGKVLAVGEFGNYDPFGTPIARVRVARLNADGTLDTSFNPGTGANNTVLRVAAQPDGKIIIAGRFTTYNGTARSRIARLNANGSLDTAFVPPTLDGDVLALGLQPDGKIIIAGQFTTAGGTARKNIARLNANGSLDTSFDAAITGPATRVTGLVIDTAGRVVFGGSFETVGGATRICLARVLSTGALDSGWNVTADTIMEVAAAADGRILIGGEFVSVSGRVRYSVARLLPDMRVPARVIGVLGVLAGLQGTLSVHYRERADLAWTDLAEWDMASQYTDDRPPHLIATPADGLAWTHGEYKVTFTSVATWVGHFGFARLWIGSAIAFDQGVDAQWTMGFADTGVILPSAGGQAYEDTGVRIKLLSVALSAKKTDLAWGMADTDPEIGVDESLHDMQMETGTTAEVIVIPRTLTEAWIKRAAVYGHIARPWEIEHQSGPNWRAGFTVEQER